MNESFKKFIAGLLEPGIQKVSPEACIEAIAQEDPMVKTYMTELITLSQTNLQDTETRKIESVKKFLGYLSSPFLDAKAKLLQTNFESVESIQVHKSAISPNELDKRFLNNENKDGNILMIKTQAYESIKAGIYETCLPKIDNDENRNYIFYGPIGIGKSFGLAMVVMELRRLSDQLIVYINNAHASTYKYLINEFRYALQFVDLDKISDEECLELHQQMTYDQKTDDLMVIWNRIANVKNPSIQVDNLWKLVEWFSVIHERVVFVFDQVFSTSNKGGLKEFMHKLLEGSNENLTTIVCSSRSPPKLMIPQIFSNDAIIKIDAKFTKQQTEEFLTNNFPHLPADDIQHRKLPKYVIEELSNFTKEIPYELSVACKVAREMKIAEEISEKDMKDLCTRYIDVRKQEIEKIHEEFKAKTQDNQAWIKYLTLTRLKCRITKELQGPYDENFCCLKSVKDESGQQYYVLDFYHPLYESWACQFYFDEIEKCRNELLGSSTLKYEKHPSSRGLALEAYCIDQLSSLCMTHFKAVNLWKFRPYKSDRTPLSSSEYFSFQIADASQFRVDSHNLARSIFEYVSPFLVKPHNKQPSQNKCDFRGKLFIPDSPYMKCLDAVFVDPDELKIFLIQITTNINGHKPSDKIFFDLLKANQQESQEKKLFRQSK